jgi:ribonucleoside-triphosphate reductase
MTVIKRDGSEVAFNLNKIENAIEKAFEATRGAKNGDIIQLLALRAVSKLDSNAEQWKIEDIQDAVEYALVETGFSDVAKAYILYRQSRSDRRDGKTVINYKKIVEDYVDAADWRVKENSTVNYSLGGLILGASGAVTANYWLSEIYDKEIGDAHKSGAMHIHDLSILAPYCAGWSLKQLIREGLGGVPGKIASAPASHLSTLCNQMVNFLGILQNEWAGAQAFSSFDTYLSAFVKKDNLDYKQVKQCIQSFIYGVNTPSRWGCQAPFSNITLDWQVPADLKDLPAIVGGKDQDFTYGECQKEMDMVNKAFIEIMTEGDVNGRGFQYPIPTYSITRDFDWSETENNKLLFEMAAKYGTPYFSNYVNSDMDPSDVRSMCPLHPMEKVLVSTDYNPEWHISTIDSLEKSIAEGREYNVLLNGKVKRARLHRFDNLPGFRRITLTNGTSVVLSLNHENLTLEGVKTTDKLTPNDYLPFNLAVLEGEGHDFDDGYLVGAFLGDGSLKDYRTVTYSLNYTTKANVTEKVKAIVARKFGAKTGENTLTSAISGKQSCVNINFHSLALKGLIEEFVDGTGIEKTLLTRALSRSVDFRRGIIEGYMATDGGENNRIYTSSLRMTEAFKALAASLGKVVNISVDDRDSSETLSDNPVYCMRIYDLDKTKYKDVFKVSDGYAWFKIKNIETVKGALGFCFEVLNDEEPYFMLPSGLVTHNCRLRLDLRDLRRKNGGFFGSGDSTGSVGVVTINMPRIGYLSESREDFFKKLDHMMDIAARSLRLKRLKLNEYMERGLYPYTKHYLGSLVNHFSTIGLVGMNEACLNARWLGKDMTHRESQQFAEEVLDHMRERLSDYQEMYPGDLYNLEATPAESTAFRLARHDRKHYPDIITAGTEQSPYYTNSSNLPVGFTEDIWEALDVQDKLQVKYTSGTVFHTFLGQRIPDYRSAMLLVRRICENYHLPYISLSPTYSICPDHGYLQGEQWECPHCGKRTEVYSRITGYYRPVMNWNAGKTQEFSDRREYVLQNRTPVKCDNSHGNKTTLAEITSDFGEVKKDIIGGNTLLFTTKTCPNCPAAKKHLQAANVAYEMVDAEENAELAAKYGIMAVPTLVTDGKLISGVGPILSWIRSRN